jgi:site-specific DNA-methyltransferase (cytosine-N4-specific)
VIVRADARVLPIRDNCVDCVVTSPPYWGGVRDYGHPLQIGLEREPGTYRNELVDYVFLEIWRVLKPTGTVWLNLGDTYAASGKGGGGNRGDRACWQSVVGRKGFRMPPKGYKQKDLTLVPFQVATALRSAGWYLRSVIVWKKPAAVEPMRLDRPAVSHEYVFLLSKSEQYAASNPGEKWWGHSVWEIASDGDASHPAAMPRELARRCIVAGSPAGGLVLDPFMGSGTVGEVAEANNRRWIGTDLSYHDLSSERTAQRGIRFGASA